jgi:hypothetical protein
MNHSLTKKPWVNIAIFENLNDGQTLEIALKNGGFEARTYNDKLLRCFLFLRPPRVTFRVQVRNNDFKNATDFLGREPAAGSLLAKAIHCPSCDSLWVQYPQMTRKFFLPTLLLHLGIIFRVIEHEAYCESCHCLWNLPENSFSVSAKAQRKSFPLNEP